MIRLSALVLGALLAGPTLAIAQTDEFTAGDQSLATANVINPDGETIGTIAFVETPSGLIIQLDIEGLPPGQHAIHVHETGTCEPPDFESAGDHFNPTDANHGFLSEGGPHAGDLPNVYAGPDGRLQGDILSPMLSLTSGDAALFSDDQGRAIVIHGSPDDYETDPSGASGGRIACGVIELQAAE
jgi:superoxide dismutase, Cu-Zn family